MASTRASTASAGGGRSGLPTPKSNTSSPRARAARFLASASARTYGGSVSRRGNVFTRESIDRRLDGFLPIHWHQLHVNVGVRHPLLMSFTKVLPLSELADRPRTVKPEGKQIAVFRVGDQIHAVD